MKYRHRWDWKLTQDSEQCYIEEPWCSFEELPWFQVAVEVLKLRGDKEVWERFGGPPPSSTPLPPPPLRHTFHHCSYKRSSPEDRLPVFSALSFSVCGSDSPIFPCLAFLASAQARINCGHAATARRGQSQLTKSGYFEA